MKSNPFVSFRTWESEKLLTARVLNDRYNSFWAISEAGIELYRPEYIYFLIGLIKIGLVEQKFWPCEVRASSISSSSRMQSPKTVF